MLRAQLQDDLCLVSQFFSVRGQARRQPQALGLRCVPENGARCTQRVSHQRERGPLESAPEGLRRARFVRAPVQARLRAALVSVMSREE